MPSTRGAEPTSLDRVFDQNIGRERILAAAVTIVATRGFGACTVREVAEAAGIKAPGLYSHFRSKEEILTEAVSRVLADFTENAAAVGDGTPEEELRDTVRRHVLYQIENVHLARVADMLLDTASAGDFVSHEDYDRLLEQQRDYLELLGRRVAAYAPKLPAPEVDIVTMAILAMCDRVAIWYDADSALTPDDVAELHWRLARRMLAD
ncbi:MULTISPECIES: TetR/AcrR family transcriptional regulator [Gordonia]|uniref:TetR/AcrR family transcriptional regulator n=1 Tax=Gordonia TaxID=2053 RepID=UPI001EF6A6FC|nr:TetR/AcrR family transcriptional regulator [Gordonia sp. McavH-238-E]MCG7634113.1 TetR/AcrR family transcriptional regulator [Gordonia sp. McavH-238-E]